MPSSESTPLLRKKSTMFGPLRSSRTNEIALTTGLHEHAVALANVDKAYGKRA
jgi:hypothetical protein